MAIKVGDRVRLLEAFWICPRCGSRALTATHYVDDPAFPPEKRGRTIANEHTKPDGQSCSGGWIVPEESKPQHRYRTGVVVQTRENSVWVEIRFDDYEDRTGCSMLFVDGQMVWLASREYYGLRPISESHE